MDNQNFERVILECTGARHLGEPQLIQNLWSGYGKILRYQLTHARVASVVVKHVRLPQQETGSRHPRGWNTNIGHNRKVQSYQIETCFYHQCAQDCDDRCRIPHCLALESQENEVLMVLEDLDSSGFAHRKSSLGWEDMEICLSWLAHFHATFMGRKPENLWDSGTYWHLATRPEELDVMQDPALKAAAPKIDAKLNESPFQTWVHGDAKLANFCFSPDERRVAAVDFQYVGGGCGMKDVAYFVGSCLYEDDCEKLESRILNTYFKALHQALLTRSDTAWTAEKLNELEANWRTLYPVAWTDFHRFLKGWSPEHWKINGYSERLAREVIAQLS